MIKSAEEFVELSRNNDERAKHEDAPESVWLEVIRNHSDLREWVAHNKSVPLSVLKILADDPDPQVRFVVAMKRKCDPEILEHLARDEDGHVRLRVVYNAKTPTSILARMSGDSSPLVAEAIVGRLSGASEGRIDHDDQAPEE
jgi:hypothetical protein